MSNSKNNGKGKRGRKAVDLSKVLPIVETKVKDVSVDVSDIESLASQRGRNINPDNLKVRIAKVEAAISRLDKLVKVRASLYRKLACVSDSRYAEIKAQKEAEREGNTEKRIEKTKKFLASLDADALKAILAEIEKVPA